MGGVIHYSRVGWFRLKRRVAMWTASLETGVTQ